MDIHHLCCEPGAGNDTADDDRRNRVLLDWLSDDEQRRELFRLVNLQCGGKLVFPSRDAAPRECDCGGVDFPRAPAVPGHVPVRLVTERSKIQEILLNRRDYSSRVYAELGGGSFMLALDPSSSLSHDAQRAAFKECFPHSQQLLIEVAHSACEATAVMSLRAPDFDLADFAEQASLRCCQLLLGYAMSDYPLLESSLRIAYRGLVHQVFDRHFVTDPLLIPSAKQAMGRLLARTSALIDAYATNDEDALKGCQDPARPNGLTPVLEKLAKLRSKLNGEQRAIVALGAAIGTVGNVQAAVCIAVRYMFERPETALRSARQLARKEQPEWPTHRLSEWQGLIAEPLRANPPIPYLPRLKVDEHGRKLEEIILALGGATQDADGIEQADSLVWGMPYQSAHWCAGQALAWPLIIEAVRRVMALPGLAEALDPVDAKVKGLKKRRGFACEAYPLTYRRDWRLAQTSLNVAMRIKAPIRDNVDRVREVIRAGAPRIERALRESRHVHFAWFEIIEADSVLVLHTVYDGPFGAYLQHFALQAGDLFDVLFEHLEDPPPMPVHKFPNEFAAHLLRYHRPPAMGYFFSAYPRSEVARIVRDEGRGP